MALDKHPSLEAAASQTRAATARIQQAHSGYLPHLSYAESWTRSDNPVFVFSSLLTQHQFTAENFSIGPLNRPGFLNNFQSLVNVDQTVYDWGATGAQVRAAEAGRAASQEQERAARLGLTARVVHAYYGVVLARASLDVAREALKSAEADAQRAESVRQAGMSTDADVLSIRVHLAGVREQEIRRDYEIQVATAALNEALGLPLDTPHSLPTSLTPLGFTADSAAQYQAAASKNRPELRQSELAREAAEHQTTGARAALLPQFAVRGAFEADRQEFVNKGGANWLISASMRWNLFDGNNNRARIAEAQAWADTARAQGRAAEQAVRLEVFRSSGRPARFRRARHRSLGRGQ